MQQDSAIGDGDDLNDNDIIGVIKIKDGLFICDELGAQVSTSWPSQTQAYFKLEVNNCPDFGHEFFNWP